MEPIIFERDNYFVVRTQEGTFEVYRNGATSASRCATIGYQGQKGLDKAKAEIDRRIGETNG